MVCKKRITLLVLIILCYILFPTKVRAVNIEEYQGMDFDYSEIQEVIDEVLSSKEKISFSDYVMKLLQGGESFSFEQILNALKDGIMNEVKANIGILTSLVSVAIIAAVFTNFSFAFQNNQVAETGFYVSYLLLFSILTASFIGASQIAREALEGVLNFMKALLPTYFLAVTFSSSATTSTVFYQATLYLITFVDILLIKLVIPLINIYLIIAMANNISKEDLLSKLGDLISVVIKWLLKTLLAAVVGFNAIQGLILPVADNVKKSILLKAAGAIPGVGDVLGSITESVIGAGVLLKNAIGIAGVVIILVICFIPILKLIITTLIYRISSAVVQPISDKRMLNCVTSSAEATSMLLQTVIVGAVLFLLTITIVAATTTR